MGLLDRPAAMHDTDIEHASEAEVHDGDSVFAMEPEDIADTLRRLRHSVDFHRVCCGSQKKQWSTLRLRVFLYDYMPASSRLHCG